MRRNTVRMWLVGSMILAALGAGAGQIVKGGGVVVQSISNTHPVLTIGGSPVTVRVTGLNLNVATGAVALWNGTAVKDILVTLGPAGSTSRDVALSANPALTKSVSGYRLRILAGTLAIDVPPDVFVMDVILPVRAREGVLDPRPSASAPVAPPNVDTTRLPRDGRTGWGIVFYGRDFVPDRFMAMIGSTLLNITYKSTTEIRANLPSQRMTAPLVVSHGTENSKVQLRAAFRVYAPAITSVVPTTFNRGSWVDIVGWDLDYAHPQMLAGPAGGQTQWVWIWDSPDPPPTPNLINVDSWTVSQAGRSARFRALDPYDGQTSAMSGKLRLYDPSSGKMDVASPTSVTYNLGLPLIITAVYPYLKWNNQKVDFILLKQGTQNVLVAEGYGIKPETRAKMGAVDLSTISGSGTQGSFSVPYQAVTSPVQFTCGPATALFPTPIKAGIWPRLDPSSYTTQNGTMMIVLNREYSLRGWGFKPSIPDLAVSLSFVFTPGSPVQLQVLEQTDNLIRFKIATTGSLPSTYMNYNEFNTSVLKKFAIIGRYQGGTPQYFADQSYCLVAQ